jgi:hypothetical protein
VLINKKSIGFILEASPLTGASEETVNILSTILTNTLPPNADLQFLLWADGVEPTAYMAIPHPGRINQLWEALDKAGVDKATMIKIAHLNYLNLLNC